MTTLTQAQEALNIIANWFTPPNDSKPFPYGKVHKLLTAAAQVGGPPDDSMEGAIKRGQQQGIVEEATQIIKPTNASFYNAGFFDAIERCAKVAENCGGDEREISLGQWIAAEIRKLKGK